MAKSEERAHSPGEYIMWMAANAAQVKGIRVITAGGERLNDRK